MAEFEEFLNLGSIGGSTDEDEIECSYSDDGRVITIDAVDGSIDIVQDFINDKLFQFGCDRKAMSEIRLAVEEIMVNIISYAYRPDVGKAEVVCEVTQSPLTVIIQFMDSGKPFDPLAQGDADTSGKQFIERAGGFGIHIVKNTMDDVEYEYKLGKNILSIRKKLES
jgi:sigma-B regulation protein RsbU (phosphoserine phosphatase)